MKCGSTLTFVQVSVNLGGGVASPVTAKQARLTNLRVSHSCAVYTSKLNLDK